MKSFNIAISTLLLLGVAFCTFLIVGSMPMFDQSFIGATAMLSLGIIGGMGVIALSIRFIIGLVREKNE